LLHLVGILFPHIFIFLRETCDRAYISGRGRQNIHGKVYELLVISTTES